MTCVLYSASIGNYYIEAATYREHERNVYRVIVYDAYIQRVIYKSYVSPERIKKAFQYQVSKYKKETQV